MKFSYKMNVTEWHELFLSLTDTLSDQTRNASYVDHALAAINQIKPELTDLQNRLFELHAQLHVLMRLTNLIPSKNGQHGYFIGFHTHSAIADVKQSISNLMHTHVQFSNEPDAWNRVLETIAFLRQLMLTETNARAYFSDTYFWLWQHWVIPNQNDMQLCMDELENLKTSANELGSSLSRYSYLLAELWMKFYLNRDQEAWTTLAEIERQFDHLQPYDLFSIFSVISVDEQWERLLNWMQETNPYTDRFRLNNLEIFYHYWDKVIEHLPDKEPIMWESLVEKLPYTGPVYEQKLLRYAKWQQWVDYQLSRRSEPLDYRVSVFAPIEKNAPELLLPFYHQAVERHILLKNRVGYKAAVKLLKRLAKLYKKTKDDDRWESYISSFSARYSRLRALQEELRKGKLIP